MCGRPALPLCTGPPFRVAWFPPFPCSCTSAPTIDGVRTTETPLASAAVERRQAGRLYGRTSTELTGTVLPTGPTVRYRDALTRRQKWSVSALGWAHVLVTLVLTGYLIAPAHLPWL